MIWRTGLHTPTPNSREYTPGIGIERQAFRIERARKMVSKSASVYSCLRNNVFYIIALF